MKNEIFQLLDEKVNEVYFYFQEKLGIKNGDISPEQVFQQDEILNELAELIESVLIMERR